MGAAAADKTITIISRFDSRHQKIKQLLTCPICNKFLRQVTAIDECLHIFCKKCITAKFTKENLHKCPVCKVDLGVSPLQKIRADYRWQSIRNSIKFKRREYIDRGLIKRKSQSSGARDKNPPPEEEEEEEEEHSPPLPVKRKEKSISSVLRAEKRASNNHLPTANGGKKSSSRQGGTKSYHPRRTPSLAVSVPPIKESLNSSADNGEHGTKQTSFIKPSNQEISNEKEGKREMNGSLYNDIPAAGSSKDIDMSDPSHDEPHANTQENEEDNNNDNNNNNNNNQKGKIDKEHTRLDASDHGEAAASSVSVVAVVPSSAGGRERGGRKRSRNTNVRSRSRSGGDGDGGSNGQEKRPVVTEDLNLPAQVVLDASSSKCFRSNHIWFSLVASDNQDTYVPLPPLPPYFLMIKDSNMPASFLMKYLVKKLRLCSENEVELTMRGKRIAPDCPLNKLVDLWKETTPTSEKKPAIVGDSAGEYVMVVTYGRCTAAATTTTTTTTHQQ